jgi:predicted RND superfamily exporter protein
VDPSRSVSLLRLFAIAFYGCGLVVCLFGFLRFESNMEDVYQWLPDRTPDRELYDEFVRQFGVDDFLVATWPECTIADPRADAFADALKRDDTAGLIDRAVSGRQLIRELVARQRQSPNQVIDRFKGVYFGPAGRATCVMVMLSARGMDQRGASVDFVKRIAQQRIGIPTEQIVLAGNPQVGAYGDAIVRSSIANYVGPSCLISTLVAWVCLRSFGLTAVVLAVGGLAAGLSIAIVILSGAKWGGLSSVIPSLAYILSVSGALHLVNYSRTGGDGRLLFRVLRIGWKPCLLSALTTAAGMVSLCRSEFPAIREFGIYCASGVVVSLACQLLLIPCCIDWLNPKHFPIIDERTESPFLDALIPWSRVIVLVFVLVTLGSGFGLRHLRSDLEVERNFSSRASVIQDIAWFEKHLGPVDQTEILVSFEQVTPEGFDHRLRLIRQAEGALELSPDVSKVLSVSAWLPDEPVGRGLRATAARAAYRMSVQEKRMELASTRYLLLDGDTETWRISVRFPFLQSTDFKRIKTELPKLVISTLTGSTDPAGIGEQTFGVQHTGVSLLYQVAQDDLVADLFWNFAFAFVLICPLMVLALQSVGQGLLAMIPNVFPAVAAYGLLGWFDVPIDIGMAIVACVALGIAVDDTTHFMLRFQDLAREQSRRRDRDRSAPLRIAFHQCSRAMLHTTLITGLGLTAFLFAPLAAMARFAGLLIALILFALLCDLVLLPSLLRTLHSTED